MATSPLYTRFVVVVAVMALGTGFWGCGGTNGSAEEHLRKAKSLIEAGDFENAYTHLNRALALDPGDPDVHHNLGWLYIYKGEPDKAKAELARLEAVAPDSAATYHLRGGLFSHLNRQEEAVQNYEKAIELDREEERPDLAHGANPQLYFDLATSLGALQEHRKALEVLQDGLSHVPDDNKVERVNFQMSICSEYYSLKEYKQAYSFCNAAHDATEDPERKDRITEFVENMKLAEQLENPDAQAEAGGEYQEPTGSD